MDAVPINARSDAGVLVLELDRAEKRNAIDLAMFDLLARELDRANNTPDVSAVLLCGAGEGFSAGHDLQAFEQWPQHRGDPVPRFLHALVDLRKPLVVALQGWAVGIGATALLHADWVLASPGARMRLPFVDLGIAPEAGSTLLLARAIGTLRARRLLLSGEPFTAEQGHDWGLVAEIVDPAQLREAAMARARQLGGKPAATVHQIKTWLADAEAVRTRIDEEIGAINRAIAVRRSGEG